MKKIQGYKNMICPRCGAVIKFQQGRGRCRKCGLSLTSTYPSVTRKKHTRKSKKLSLPRGVSQMIVRFLIIATFVMVVILWVSR